MPDVQNIIFDCFRKLVQNPSFIQTSVKRSNIVVVQIDCILKKLVKAFFLYKFHHILILIIYLTIYRWT